eukprot:4182190-Alexandrium_andersonii.AAC.1
MQPCRNTCVLSGCVWPCSPIAFATRDCHKCLPQGGRQTDKKEGVQASRRARGQAPGKVAGKHGSRQAETRVCVCTRVYQHKHACAHAQS